MPFDETMAEFARRKEKALAMGGPEKLARRHQAGLLDARQRLDLLLDPGSWTETGIFAAGIRPEVRDRTATGRRSIEDRFRGGDGEPGGSMAEIRVRSEISGSVWKIEVKIGDRVA
jgi:hypothetical protein